MRAHAHVVLLIGFLVTLFVNLLLHGGLARIPEGKPFLDSARRESPLALAYMTGGEWLLKIPGLAGIGEPLAREAFGAAFAAAEDAPGAASDLLETGDFGRATSVARTIYWATPLLFVAWLIAFLLRPREVHLVRKRR